MWENETAADAALAVQMGNEIVGCFYLLGPSIHLGQPAGLPSILQQQQAKRKKQFSFLGEVSHLKPRWWFPQGNRTASPIPPTIFPQMWKTWLQRPNGRKRLTSLGPHAAQWFNTERLSYPGLPARFCACVCLIQFCDTSICRGTRTLVST